MKLCPFLGLRLSRANVWIALAFVISAPAVYAQKVVDPIEPQVPVVQGQTQRAVKGTINAKKPSATNAPTERIAQTATSFTNATAITLTDCPNPCPASGQAASLYPSPITVSGEVGVVQRVSVTINGFSHAF